MYGVKISEGNAGKVLEALRVLEAVECLTREEVREVAEVSDSTINSMLSLACNTIWDRIELVEGAELA